MTKTALDESDLMFKSQHLMFLLFLTTAKVVLIFIIRFLYKTPLLLTFDLVKLSGRGTDTVIMGLWVGITASTEACRTATLSPRLN